MVSVNRIENGHILWVKVNSDRHENERLWIFTGVAVLNTWHISDDESWSHDYALISMSHIRGAPLIHVLRGQWIDATAIASPTSIRFKETIGRDQVGFAVDSATPYSPDPTGDHPSEYGVNVQLALMGNDISLYRINFQLNVLTRDVS